MKYYKHQVEIYNPNFEVNCKKISIIIINSCNAKHQQSGMVFQGRRTY